MARGDSRQCYEPEYSIYALEADQESVHDLVGTGALSGVRSRGCPILPDKEDDMHILTIFSQR